jgi:diguanylate cyclase (GGDEF)-like protein
VSAAPSVATPDSVPDLVAASRRLLPRLWGGEDVEVEARELLESARAAKDAEGECGALYVAMAAAAVRGDSERSRVAATTLAQRGATMGLPVWECMGRTHLARLHLTDGHENLAIEAIVDAELLIHDCEPSTILAVAFNGIAATYSRLAVYEDSERLYARSAEVLRVASDQWAEQTLVYNRLLNHATWGLALHRAGESDEAHDRLTVAVDQVREGPDLTGSRLWCDLATLCLFVEVMIGEVGRDAALERFDRIRVQGNVESESFVRFALAHRYAEADMIEAARDQVAAGIAALHPIEGGPVRTALTWERARIAVLERPDDPAIRDVWDYAELATSMVWQLRLRRVESVRDRLRIGLLQRQHQLAERAAEEDPLTGVPNRRRLDRERERLSEGHVTGWVTVAYLDVDRFKPINDTYGHDLGDAVLRDVAALLTDHVRIGDLVSRYGGDEFVIIAEDCAPAAAQRLAHRILAAMRMHDWAAFAPDLQVHLSIGMATGAADHGALFARADDALYAAKHLGGDRAELVVVETGVEA